MTRRVVHCETEPYDVYVGRPSKWGNPFSHKADSIATVRVKTRVEAIESYGKWLLTQPELISSLHELRGKVLGCWCYPHRCHGEILSRLANPMNELMYIPGTEWMFSTLTNIVDTLRCRGADHFSLSQIKLFLRCNRKWWFEKVAGYEEPKTQALIDGNEYHEQSERFQLGELQEHDLSPCVRAMFNKRNPDGSFLLPRLQGYQVLPKRPDTGTWQNPITGLVYAFAGGDPKFITRNPQARFFYEERVVSRDRAEEVMSRYWMKFDPVIHTGPEGLVGLVLEWHVNHHRFPGFALAEEGYIDYWQPGDQKTPHRIRDYKFIKDFTFATTEEEMAYDLQQLLYARYIWEIYPDHYPEMYVGQVQVSKTDETVEPVEVLVDKEHVFRQTDLYRPIVREMERVGRINDVRETFTNAPDGLGKTRDTCIKYGKPCYFAGKCKAIGVNEGMSTLMAAVNAAAPAPGTGFTNPDARVALHPFPTDGDWTNPNTNLMYHFRGGSPAWFRQNKDGVQWTAFDKATSPDPTTGQVPGSMPPVPGASSMPPIPGSPSNILASAVNPPPHNAPGYVPPTNTIQSAPPPTSTNPTQITGQTQLDGIPGFGARAAKKLMEYIKPQDGFPYGVRTPDDIAKLFESQVQEILGNGANNGFKGMMTALETFNLPKPKPGSPAVAAGGPPPVPGAGAPPNSQPSTPFNATVELGKVAAGHLVEFRPEYNALVIAHQEGGMVQVKVQKHPEADKIGDVVAHQAKMVCLPIKTFVWEPNQNCKYINGAVGKVSRIEGENVFFQINGQGQEYQSPWYSVSVPMEAFPQSGEWSNANTGYNYYFQNGTLTHFRQASIPNWTDYNKMTSPDPITGKASGALEAIVPQTPPTTTPELPSQPQQSAPTVGSAIPVIGPQRGYWLIMGSTFPGLTGKMNVPSNVISWSDYSDRINQIVIQKGGGQHPMQKKYYGEAEFFEAVQNNPPKDGEILFAHPSLRNDRQFSQVFALLSSNAAWASVL